MSGLLRTKIENIVWKTDLIEKDKQVCIQPQIIAGQNYVLSYPAFSICIIRIFCDFLYYLYSFYLVQADMGPKIVYWEILKEMPLLY